MRTRRTAIGLVGLLCLAMAALAPGAAAAASSGFFATQAVVGPGAMPWTFSGQACRLIPTSATAALGVGGACADVRPGAPVLTPIGQCTLNFLWEGSDDRHYIGTAGHCLLEGSSRSQAVFSPGEGPLARDSSGRRIGEFAYAALDAVSDFALIRLDLGVQASPVICRFGGPTGMEVGPIPTLTPLHHVGRGQFTGSLVPARTQLTIEGGDIRMLTGLGVASAGDSGSPLIGLDGKAVGVVVATGPALLLAPVGPLVLSTRIAPEMGRASAAMGTAFDLVTAPRAGGVRQP